LRQQDVVVDMNSPYPCNTIWCQIQSYWDYSVLFVSGVVE